MLGRPPGAKNREPYQGRLQHRRAHKKRVHHRDALICRLIDERLAQGLSQNDLAQIVGCAGTQISEWENRRHELGATKLAAWANALELDIVLLPMRERIG